MTCRRARKQIPLLAGNDLSEKHAQNLIEHLETCSECRKEYREYQAVLDKAKKMAVEETTADWTETEWKALMDRIGGERAVNRPIHTGFRMQPALASGVGIVFLALMIGIFLKDRFSGNGAPALKPAPRIVTTPKPAAPPVLSENIEKERTMTFPRKKPSPVPKTRVTTQDLEIGKTGYRPGRVTARQKESSQDVVKITMISQTSGLKVVWLLDKNFEWKGDSE